MKSEKLDADLGVSSQYWTRNSSSSRLSGIFRSSSGRKGGRKRNDKGWPECNVIVEEGDYDDESGFSHRFQALIVLLSFVLLFTVLCLIIWGAVRPFKVEAAVKVWTFWGYGIYNIGILDSKYRSTCLSFWWMVPRDMDRFFIVGFQGSMANHQALAVIWCYALQAYIFTESSEVAAAVADLSPLLACSILLNSIQPVLLGVAIGAGWQSIVAYVNIGCCAWLCSSTARQRMALSID